MLPPPLPRPSFWLTNMFLTSLLSTAYIITSCGHFLVPFALASHWSSNMFKKTRTAVWPNARVENMIHLLTFD